MSKLLPQIEEGWDAIMRDKDQIVCAISGEMTFFPLCCSTGIIKGLTAQAPQVSYAPAFNKGEAITGVDVQNIKDAKYIHQIVRACSIASRPVFFPLEVALWNALSLILLKTVEGTDDGPSGGYNNYKAAQIVMCDRVLDDKRDPKFNFSHYNIVFSVDQLMTWLDNEGAELGEFYSSPPRPGGHGARVRSGIFTPNAAALEQYLGQYIDKVRSHALSVIQGSADGVRAKAVDKVAASW